MKDRANEKGSHLLRTRQGCPLITMRKKRRMNSHDNVMVLAAPMLLARDPSIAVMNAAYSLPSGSERDRVLVHGIIPAEVTQEHQARFLLNGFLLVHIVQHRQSILSSDSNERF